MEGHKVNPLKNILNEKVYEKPWGRERWLNLNKHYCFKILEINKGEMFSLQYHEVKHETWFVNKGRIEVTLDERTFELLPGMIVEIPPGTIHRMHALEEASVFEVSTPEVEDVVRIEDKYGRPKKGYEWEK